MPSTARKLKLIINQCVNQYTSKKTSAMKYLVVADEN